MKQLKFNAEMAQAVNDGRKTQTRRPVKSHVPMDKINIVFTADFETFSFHSDAHYYFDLKTPYKIGDTHKITTEEPCHYCGIDGCEMCNGMGYQLDTISIKITNIRVERLQDISEEDAIAEGVGQCAGGGYGTIAFNCATSAFEFDIWNKLPYQPPHDWNSNPYVWVIEFEVIS